jgi:hypothetical protein
VSAVPLHVQASTNRANTLTARGASRQSSFRPVASTHYEKPIFWSRGPLTPRLSAFLSLVDQRLAEREQAKPIVARLRKVTPELAKAIRAGSRFWSGNMLALRQADRTRLELGFRPRRSRPLPLHRPGAPRLQSRYFSSSALFTLVVKPGTNSRHRGRQSATGARGSTTYSGSSKRPRSPVDVCFRRTPLVQRGPPFVVELPTSRRRSCTERRCRCRWPCCHRRR